jgi:hypothetical protein
MAGYEAASAALAKAGDMLLAAPDWSVNEPAARATLAPGEELALNLPPGASAVRNLRVQIDPKDAPQVLRSTILLAEFDGEPAIWCPIGEFFGAGARLNPVQDWFRTVQEDGKMFARWVMPYERSARFTLKNHGTNPITVSLAAATSPWKWDDRSLRFHANWRCQNAMKTRPMFDWNYLEIYGRGVYVGDTLTVFSPVSAWYGEGDERVYLDGETLPSHNGTGTEDYYGYAWGMATFFNSPFISMPHRDSKSRESSKGYTTTSRVRLLDGYPLRSSFKLDMEIWHAADTKVDYAVGTFWYARPGATHNRPPQPAEAAQPLAGSATSHLRGAIECETMKVAAKSGDFSVGEQDLEPFGAERWSNGRHLFGQTTAVGDTVEIEWLVSDPAPRKLVLYATQAPDYATLRFQVNGQIVAATFDGYAESVRPAPAFPLGVFTPHDGKFTLRAEVVGANPAAKGRKYFFGLDCVTVEKP